MGKHAHVKEVHPGEPAAKGGTLLLGSLVLPQPAVVDENREVDALGGERRVEARGGADVHLVHTPLLDEPRPLGHVPLDGGRQHLT